MKTRAVLMLVCLIVAAASVTVRAQQHGLSEDEERAGAMMNAWILPIIPARYAEALRGKSFMLISDKEVRQATSKGVWVRTAADRDMVKVMRDRPAFSVPYAAIFEGVRDGKLAAVRLTDVIFLNKDDPVMGQLARGSMRSEDRKQVAVMILRAAEGNSAIEEGDVFGP
jgi:hypothetical protein